MASVLGDGSVLTILIYSSWEYLSDTHFSKKNSFLLVFVVLVFYLVIFFGYAGSLFLHLDFSLVVVSRGCSLSPVCRLLIAVASSTLASTVAVHRLRCPAACESPQARPQTRVSCIGRCILNRCTTRGVLSALSESKQTPLPALPDSLTQHSNGFSAESAYFFPFLTSRRHAA